MLNIQIDSKAIEHRLNGMLQRLGQLKSETADEFASWQTDDMHRQKASVRRVRRAAWATTIRPHSRFEMQRRRRLARRLVRKGRFIPRWSTRPILRRELEERLVERMADLLRDFKW